MELTFDETGKVLSTYVPSLLAAIAILVIGWLVAWIIAAAVRGGLRRTQLDNRLARWIAGGEPAKTIPIELWISRAVFYLLMIFVLVGFFHALQLTLPSEPLNQLLVRLFQFIPQLAGAAILLLIAWVLASII